MTNAEHLLGQQLAACLAAIQDCLAHSRAGREDDPFGHQRRNDLAYAAKLVKASARLTEALAKLRGETHHEITVNRTVDKGQG